MGHHLNRTRTLEPSSAMFANMHLSRGAPLTRLPMKHLLTTIMLMSVLSMSCSSRSSQSLPSTNVESKDENTIVWSETGLVLTVLPGWKLDNDNDNSQRTFKGPGNARFSVFVTTHTPESSDRSFGDETKDFYENHKDAGEEDLRYLEVNGLKGVHYLREENGFDENNQPQGQRHIVWNAQRTHKDTRQVITITLSSPSKDFAEYRETLYRLLQSIKFI